MVRRDPMNERGPAPPGGRVKKEVRVQPTNLFQLRPEGEYKLLWQQAALNAEHCVYLIEGYVFMGVPYAPVEKLRNMRDCLDRIIKHFEE